MENQNDREVSMLKQPIIPIKRASESTIMALIKMGILEITDSGIRVKEK